MEGKEEDNEDVSAVDVPGIVAEDKMVCPGIVEDAPLTREDVLTTTAGDVGVF